MPTYRYECPRCAAVRQPPRQAASSLEELLWDGTPLPQAARIAAGEFIPNDCEVASEHHQILLITGPNGVDGTTTFHHAIDLINAESRKKIITIEDPVEYQLPGVTQI